ncbi:hypothetical protein YC2023_079145 [Brassica napus]
MWDIISLISLLEMMTLIGQKSRNFKTVILGRTNDIGHFTAHTCRWISNAVKRGISDLDLRITMTSTERQVHHHDETLFKCPIPSIVFTSKTLVKFTLGT